MEVAKDTIHIEPHVWQNWDHHEQVHVQELNGIDEDQQRIGKLDHHGEHHRNEDVTDNGDLLLKICRFGFSLCTGCRIDIDRHADIGCGQSIAGPIDHKARHKAKRQGHLIQRATVSEHYRINSPWGFGCSKLVRLDGLILWFYLDVLCELGDGHVYGSVELHRCIEFVVFGVGFYCIRQWGYLAVLIIVTAVLAFVSVIHIIFIRAFANAHVIVPEFFVTRCAVCTNIVTGKALGRTGLTGNQVVKEECTRDTS